MNTVKMRIETNDIAGMTGEPLPGTVVPQFIRCGKPGCRCQTGERHGPYYYRVWREGNRVRKVYVPLTQMEKVVLQCNLYLTQQDYLKRLMAERRALTAALLVQIAECRKHIQWGEQWDALGRPHAE